MTKKHNNIDDDKNKVPPGEDQFILGWDDALRLEKEKGGLAKAFFNSDVVLYSHDQYVKGFMAAATANDMFVDD